MPRPRNIKKLLDSLNLSSSEWLEAQEYFKEDPRVTELKRKKAEIEAELAALTGTSPKGKRGRPAKAVSSPAKASKPKGRRGRPSKAANAPEATMAPKKRGRPAVSTPASRAAAAKTKVKPRKPMSPETLKKKRAALAKARAAKAAKAGKK